MRTELESALVALRDRDESSALSFLLAAWRASRAPALEKLIERVTALVCPADRPHTHGGYDHVFNRPVVLTPVTMGHVIRELVQKWGVKTLLHHTGAAQEDPRLGHAIRAYVETHVKSLLLQTNALPEDPRMRPLLLAAAMRLDIKIEAASALAVSMEMKRLADRHLMEQLAAWCATLPPGDARSEYWDRVLRLPTVSEAPVNDEEQALLQDLSDRLHVLERATPSTVGMERELLLRVYADPDDVSARLVLADSLLDAGEPLGELIQLQCHEAPGPEVLDRINSLLERSRERWVSALQPTPPSDRVHFERGFPGRVGLAVEFYEPQMRFDLDPNEAWLTVRDLELGLDTHNAARTLGWISHQNLRNVHTLRTRSAGVRTLSEAVIPTLPMKTLIVRLTGGQLGATGISFSGLPNLVTLELRDANAGSVSDLLLSPVADRLTAFSAVRSGSWKLHLKRGSVADRWDGALELQSEHALAAAVEIIRSLSSPTSCALRITCSRRLTDGQRDELTRAAAGLEVVQIELSPGP